MAFKMPSNRKLHPQNSKVVDKAIDRIKTTAPIAQEKYWNAFRVNGYTCNVFNILGQGIKCTCSYKGTSGSIAPILDENGNAPDSFIQSMISGGLSYGIEEYGTEPTNPLKPNTKITQLDTHSTVPTNRVENTNLDTPNMDFTIEDFTEEDLNPTLSNATSNKCGICFGSGYVGGFELCFGNRIVLDSTYKETKQFGYTIDTVASPNVFEQMVEQDSYVEFTVTLPVSVFYISALNLKCNVESAYGIIEASLDGNTYTEVSPSNLKNYCVGYPIKLRVSECSIFTHLEIQLVLSDEVTYLEYPKMNKTGDISVLDDTGDVLIYVSPKIPLIKPKSIIVDNTLGKIWRVINVGDHKDRNINIHGWEVNARLVQSYELFTILPINKTSQRQKQTNLNRY